MPSNLQRRTRLTKQRTVFGQSSFVGRMAPAILTLRGNPWGGYVPDIDSALLSLVHAEACIGLIDRGGKLVPAPGFFRVDNSTAELPLGGPSFAAADAGETLAFVAAADTITRSQPGATGSFVDDGFAAGDTITVAGSASNEGDHVIASGGVAADIITCVDGTVADEGATADIHIYKALPATAAQAEAVVGMMQFTPTTSTTPTQVAITAVRDGTVGHLWTFSGGAWSPAHYSHADTNEHTGTTNDLFDWAYFPWMSTSGQVVFCNDNSGDTVYKYPDGDGEYEDLDHAADGITDLEARSVCRYTERIILFNVTEDAARTSQQVTYSAVGNQSMSASGSGTIQVSGTDGKGVKCLPIGNYVALYLEDGVAFMRGTGVPTAPFEIDYVSEERGLIGTFAVVDVGGGTHFGLFTDGWFFLNSSGGWTEAGVMFQQGSMTRKWTRTFYEKLDWPNRNRTVIAHDRRNNEIRISFPVLDGGYEVWHYKIETNTIWPDDYGNHVPTYWGNWNDTRTSLTWANADTYQVDPSAPVLDSWEAARSQGVLWSYGEDIGQDNLTHGVSTGYLFQQQIDLTTRDSEDFTYQWKSHRMDTGDLAAYTLLDKIYIEYERLSPESPHIISVTALVDDNEIIRTINQDKGTSGQTQIEYINCHKSGQRFGYEVSGTTPAIFKGFQLHIYREGDSLVTPVS